LDNLASIGGNLNIKYNESLENVIGLENLYELGGNLDFFYNNVLTSLSGLGNLTSIDGALIIQNHNILKSLTGLDNIDESSIDHLYIASNDSLSTCEVESICNYLVNPNGEIQIFSNAPGCNNPTEVEQACETTPVEDLTVSKPVIIKPNPFSTSITIEVKLEKPGTTGLQIYNHLGQLIKEFSQQSSQPGTKQFAWNANGQPSGIYFIWLKAGNEIITKKIIKH